MKHIIEGVFFTMAFFLVIAYYLAQPSATCRVTCAPNPVTFATPWTCACGKAP